MTSTATMLPNATVVVDANVAFAWTVGTVHSNQCNKILRLASSIIAPDLIIAEVTNAIFMKIEHSTSDGGRLLEGLEILPRWFSELVPSIKLSSNAMKLAIELDHSAYDCFYLALALNRDVQFITADLHFLRKAEAKGYKKSVVNIAEI